MLVFENSVDCCGCVSVRKDGEIVGSLMRCGDWLSDIDSSLLDAMEHRQIADKLDELNAKGDKAQHLSKRLD